MKNKIILIITLMICMLSVNSQQTSRLISDYEIDPGRYTSKIYAPSSNSFLFMKYGNLSADKSTGAFNYSVPLHKIEYKDISIPISLGYASTGLKVDEEDGIVGQQWNLNFGGIVTRIVKDRPDDNSKKWYPLSISIRDLDDSRKTDLYNKAMDRTKLDTERDQFFFSINGQSGSFIIDENYNVYTDSKDFVKINFSPINYETNQKYSSITITDGRGYKYVFGGNEKYVDQTTISNESALLPNPLTYISSWQLKEIESPLYNKILFDYENVVNTVYNSSSLLFIKRPDTESPSKAEEVVTIHNTTTNSKFIKRIYAEDNSFQINFKYKKDLLDNVLIKNEYEIVKTIDFDYFTVGNKYGSLPTEFKYDLKNKNFLNHILFSNYTNKDTISYSFEYHLLNEVRSANTYTKDKYGYRGNTYSYPYNKDLWEDTSQKYNLDTYSSFYFNANLEVNPDVVHAGMLKKITYPTGGYTEINYEPNSSLGLVPKDRSKGYSVGMGFDYKDKERTDYSATTSFVAETDMPSIAINFITQLTYFNGPNRGDGGTGEAFGTLYINNIEILKMRQNVGTYVNNGKAARIVNDRTHNISIKKGDLVKLKIDLPNAGEERTSSFGFTVNITVLEPGKVYQSGVRVKDITDYSSDKKSYNKKSYYYNSVSSYPSIKSSIQGSSLSSHEGVRSYQVTIPTYRPGVVGAIMEKKTQQVINTFPYGYFFSNIRQAVNYSTITEFHEIDGKSNGAIQRTFFTPQMELGGLINGPSTIAPIPLTNKDESLRGQLATESFFEKKDNEYLLRKKTKYDYSLLYSKKVKSFSISSIDNFSLTLDSTLKQISIVQYDNYIQLYKLSHVSDTTYLNNVYSFSNKTYSYDNFPYFTLKKVNDFSSGMYNIEKAFNYPYDQITNSYNKELVDQNRISDPIEEIITNNNKEISRSKITYQQDPKKTNSLILPFQILRSRGEVTDLTTELTYDKYDTSGNLLQYTGKDGVSVSYLWSYKGQYPIAEIKNATYAEVQTALGVDPATISDLENPDMSKIDGLRSKLPNAMVTTYTYKPLVGMLTATDLTGVTTHYEYDDFGRLKHTYIDNEKAGKDLVQTIQYNYWNSGNNGKDTIPQPDPEPIEPEIPEGLLPDAYQKGLASSVYISIPTDGNGIDMQGWDYDNNTIQDGQPIVKTYKTIEIDEYTWLSENLRLKYKWNDWMNITQANVDDYSNFYLGGKKITLQQFENIFGTWVSLYPKALSYQDRFTVFSSEGGSQELGWQLPSSADIWQLYGLAPHKSGNIYQDIQDFLFMSPCENDLDLRKNMMNRENTSGLTLTPLGMRESYYGDNASIYGFGTLVGLRTNGWARIEAISDLTTSGILPGMRSPDLYHFSQARYTKPKTDQELGYKMYVDAANDNVLMLPYDQSSTLPELEKGLERGIALRYANREYKVVLKKWSEIQVEASEIRNALVNVSVPQPLPACDRPIIEVLPDPYEKGKAGKTTMWLSAAPPNYGVYAFDYDNNVGMDQYDGSWKTYPTIEIGEYEVTSQNLMVHYRDKWGVLMNWMNFTQDIIDQMNQDFQGENNVSLAEFQDINGGYVSLYAEAPSYRNDFRFYEPTDRTKQIAGWDLMSSTDFFQMMGQAPIESDNVYQNTMDFLGASQADVPENYKANWFRNKNTSGFTMTPLGRRHSGEAGDNEQKWFAYKIESSFRLKDYPTGLISFNESQGITINTYLYHFCQARYSRPKTDQELGYKMYIDAASDQVIMLPYTESSALPELPKGMERGVALRYTNREHLKVTKPWSEIQAEASVIKSTIKYETN